MWARNRGMSVVQGDVAVSKASLCAARTSQTFESCKTYALDDNERPQNSRFRKRGKQMVGSRRIPELVREQ
jgi:hypothetical protein